MITLKINEIPLEERPRERMVAYGPQALSHAELLAILLRTGSASESALQLASRIIKKAGGLRNLADLSLEQMTQIKGIGKAKAVQILAGIELGRRLSKSEFGERTAIRSPEDAAEYVMEDLRYHQNEHFVCLFLNTKNQVLAQETLSIGSLNASIVHPREIFRAAIKRSSASIICVHNHPSGDPTPSPEDIQITERLVEAGELVGIEVLDHIIIGDKRYISLKEQGLM